MRYCALVLAAALVVPCLAATAQPIFRPPIYGHRWYWIPYQPASMSFGLTPEQAAARVRTWMQNPALQLQVVGIATDRTPDYLQADPWPTWELELQYMLQGSDGRRYFVRIHPWVGIDYYDSSADTACGQDPGLYISDAQRQAVAETFVRGRSPDLWGAEHHQQHYGRVMSRYQGVLHLDRFTACDVHKETATLISCRLVDPGVPAIPLTPAVSVEAARSIAGPFLLQTGAYVAVAPSTAGSREQFLFIASDPMTLVHRLAWSVPLTATRANPPTPDGIWYEHDVHVDAQTGEPFNIESYLGGSAPRTVSTAIRRSRTASSLPVLLKLAVGEREVQTAMPPIAIAGRPYLWAGWLRSPLMGSVDTRVEYRAGRLVITRGAERWAYDVLVGARAQAVPSSRTALLRYGRCYVPLEVVGGIAGMSVSYDAKTRTVRLDRTRRASPVRRDQGGTTNNGARRTHYSLPR